MADNNGGWQVVSQEETSELGPANTLIPGVTITFTTSAGNTGTVFIARRDYTLDNVRDMVSKQAELMDSVSALTVTEGK